ncbi:MAG: DUF3794 domain-containing protein [Oscillospiraceae bacterium]|nr:DUF3794 domain-containing protein [Oscillospiraceae bacterium]
MELSLEKKITKRCERVFCGSTLHEENTEMIVPDQSPDIMRIVKGCADAFLKDKNVRDGKIDVSGNIKGAVLYIAEGEKNIRKLDVSVPFAYVIDAPGVNDLSKVSARVFLRSLDVREINPRKVSVRANVELSVCVYAERELALCRDISGEDEHGICTKKNTFSVYSPVNIREKSFTISDDIELSPRESGMGTILTASVVLKPADTKIIGNKAIIKGNACMSYVYEAEDGLPGCGEYELPFSQIIDVEGMDESNDLKISLSVSGFELEPQYDAAGKAHYMTASIAADAVVTVFAEESIELVDDVYSTKLWLDVQRSEEKCSILCRKLEKRVAVSESIEAGGSVRNVLDVSVFLLPPSRRRDEGGEVLCSDAVITVMYVGEDDGVYSASRRTSVVCPMPLTTAHSYEATASVSSKSCAVGASGEINVRFFTDFDMTETEEITVPVISMVSADAENRRDTGNTPSVIVKRLTHESDIWSLAKEYCTTVGEIKLANDIVDDVTLSPGRMVLIPKKR